jgi:hypothetical protein
MFISYVTDCADQNAKVRQATRLAGLFGVSPTIAGVRPTLDTAAELEAAGTLVDVLDAGEGAKGVVLVNVAPRNGTGKQYDNGTPFGYFWLGDVLVCTTLSGYTLSLVKKLGLAKEAQEFNLRASVEEWIQNGIVSEDVGQRIIHSQFRSYDFLPRAAHAVYTGVPVVASPFNLSAVPDVEPRVFFIDSFGNVKTTLLASELEGKTVLQTVWGDLPVVRSLKDVAEGTVACTVGSSGIHNQRFVEIVVQGAHAAKKLNITGGEKLFSGSH